MNLFDLAASVVSGLTAITVSSIVFARLVLKRRRGSADRRGQSMGAEKTIYQRGAVLDADQFELSGLTTAQARLRTRDGEFHEIFRIIPPKDINLSMRAIVTMYSAEFTGRWEIMILWRPGEVLREETIPSPTNQVEGRVRVQGLHGPHTIEVSGQPNVETEWCFDAQLFGELT